MSRGLLITNKMKDRKLTLSRLKVQSSLMNFEHSESKAVKGGISSPLTGSPLLCNFFPTMSGKDPNCANTR